MGNYELRAKVSQLQRELGQVKNINSQLRNEVATITNGVNSANRQLTEYNSQLLNGLDRCNSSMNSSTDKVIAAYELQGEIEHLYKRYKNIELANKNIRACNNKRYYEFANYRTVRRLVQGMMDNLDHNIISQGTLIKSIEKQHLQVPDYWLTCVLISIMAWRNDDKGLAESAMDRALRLDKKSSSIFYMIFNLRVGREEAAVKWFHVYQQCHLKGSDQRTFLMLFSLVSRTMQNPIHENTESEIKSFIKKVITKTAEAEGFSEEKTLSGICSYLQRMKPNNQLEYTQLNKLCLEISYLTDVLMRAKNNISILEFMRNIISVADEEKNEYLNVFIQDLVAQPNEAEQAVYSEIAYNELVIEKQGNVEEARAIFDAQSLKETDALNLVEEMIDWIYGHEDRNVNGQIKLNLLTLTKDYQEKAVSAYAEEYRSKFKTNFDVKIWDYSTNMDFSNEPGERQKINMFYLEKQQNALDQVKDTTAYVGLGLAGASLIAAFFTSYLLFAFSIAGLGFGAYKLVVNRALRKQIASDFAEKSRQGNDTIGKLFMEFQMYLSEYKQYDLVSEQIRYELARL